MEDNWEKVLEQVAYPLEDDMTFKKANISTNRVKLQKETIEFVTSVILNHEKKFYDITSNHFNGEYEKILGETRKHIIDMITESTNRFFNNLYFDIQNKIDSDLTTLVYKMCSYMSYGPHILLDKLLRLTYDAHIEINREELICDRTYDNYIESVLMQINIYLKSKNLLHIMAKGPDDDTPFVNVPENTQPLAVIIDKNIEF